MKVKWLDRALLAGPYLALVLSQKEFDEALGHCDVPKDKFVHWIKNAQSDATAHYLENAVGELVCIVAIRPTESATGVQIAAMIVHEAVHVFQQFRDSIGEDAPSAEFEAYSIQSISQRLMEAYAHRIGGKNK
jgi:hypothetical protein